MFTKFSYKTFYDVNDFFGQYYSDIAFFICLNNLIVSPNRLYCFILLFVLYRWDNTDH